MIANRVIVSAKQMFEELKAKAAALERAEAALTGDCGCGSNRGCKCNPCKSGARCAAWVVTANVNEPNPLWCVTLLTRICFVLAF
jgi:hypothetical protein